MFNGYSLLLVLIIMIVVCLVARHNIGYEEREEKEDDFRRSLEEFKI